MQEYKNEKDCIDNFNCYWDPIKGECNSRRTPDPYFYNIPHMNPYEYSDADTRTLTLEQQDIILKRNVLLNQFGNLSVKELRLLKWAGIDYKNKIERLQRKLEEELYGMGGEEFLSSIGE